MATVLLYLTDTEEGGETAFPAGSTWQDPTSPQRYGPFSECAQGSVAVRPRKGAPCCLDSRCSLTMIGECCPLVGPCSAP